MRLHGAAGAERLLPSSLLLLLPDWLPSIPLLAVFQRHKRLGLIFMHSLLTNLFSTSLSLSLSRAARLPVVSDVLHKTDDISLTNFIHFSPVAEKVDTRHRVTNTHARPPALHRSECSKISPRVNHPAKGRAGNKTSRGGFGRKHLHLHTATRAQERNDVVHMHESTESIALPLSFCDNFPRQCNHKGSWSRLWACRPVKLGSKHRHRAAGQQDKTTGSFSPGSTPQLQDGWQRRVRWPRQPEAELRPCRGNWRVVSSVHIAVSEREASTA